MNTRRQFLIRAPLGFLVGAAACRSEAPAPPSQSPATPGAPPTFGTGAGSGPEVTPATSREAKKRARVRLPPPRRQGAAESGRTSRAPSLERRRGPRKAALAAPDAPASVWNPLLPGAPPPPLRDRFVRSPA